MDFEVYKQNKQKIISVPEMVQRFHKETRISFMNQDEDEDEDQQDQEPATSKTHTNV